MKIKRCFMVVVAMALCGSAFGFADGDGSPGNPYQVSTRAHLEAVNDDLAAHYILINDIDLAGVVYSTAVISIDPLSN